jgi:hypothetical protein
MDTKQMNREELKELICECVDQSVHCPSMLAIQDMGFELAKIDQQIISIIRFINKRVKPVLEQLESTRTRQ